jgi:hypothetical protein
LRERSTLKPPEKDKFCPYAYNEELGPDAAPRRAAPRQFIIKPLKGIDEIALAK